MALLCLCGTAFGQIYSNNYYFSSSTLPNYRDVTTVKATEQVSSTENITVGYARESTSSFSNDIVVVKTNVSDGTVVWAKRYGVSGKDERGFGLDVTYNGQDIIVVGSAQNGSGTTFDRNAFAMRLQILTGNVVWSNEYGTIGTGEEWRMIEKTYGLSSSVEPAAPTYFLAGSSSTNNQKSIIYTGAIFENGTAQYLRRYQEVFSSNAVHDFAYTMVRNKSRNFILAGTRYESTQPSRIFTIGISPLNGNVTDRYLFYGVGTDSHYGGGIDQLTFTRSAQEAFALTFTTSNPQVETGVSTAITVMLLNQDREPKWINYYWQKEHRLNYGYSIYQNAQDEKRLSVYTNNIKTRYNPGFLSLNLDDGAVNYYVKYNLQDVNDNKFATAMVETPNGYLAKALHRDGDNGFTLAALNAFGRTRCAGTELIEKKERKPSVAKRTYLPSSYGTTVLRKVDKISVHGKAERCDGTGGYSFRLAATNTDATEVVESEETFHVYPNPVARDGGNLNLSYTLVSDRSVEISVFNALGQQTASRQVALSVGSQVLELENSLLSPGLNLVTVRSEGEVLFQARVVMH